MKLFATLALFICLAMVGCADTSSTPGPSVLAATNKVEATVTGMDCSGCTGSVCSAVEQIAGVTGAHADLETGLVTVALAEDADADAASSEIEKVIAGLQDGKYTVSTIAAVKAEEDQQQPADDQEQSTESTEGEPEANAGSGPMIYTVSGMTCTACSDKVTKAIAAVEGVESATVCHMTGKASFVSTEGAKVCPVSVAKAIESTGFKVVKESCDSDCKDTCDSKNKSEAKEELKADAASEGTVFTVTGMDCTSCSSKVTKAVAAIDGIESATVCAKSGKCTVVAADGSYVCPVKVTKAIESAGFKVAQN